MLPRGVNNSKRDRIFSLDRWFLDSIGLKFPGEAPIQAGLGLDAQTFYGIKEAIQKMGCCNCLSCLRKRLFLKLVQALLYAVGMLEYVSINMEDLESREGWILEMSIELQDGSEASPLPLNPLMLRILWSP